MQKSVDVDIGQVDFQYQGQIGDFHMRTFEEEILQVYSNSDHEMMAEMLVLSRSLEWEGVFC